MSFTMVGRQRKFYVSDGLKMQRNVREHKFLVKYFYQYFQIVSIFIYNESPADKILSIFQNLQTL